MLVREGSIRCVTVRAVFHAKTGGKRRSTGKEGRSLCAPLFTSAGVTAEKGAKRAIPNLELAQWRFLLAAKGDDICTDRAAIQTLLRAAIVQNSASPPHTSVRTRVRATG